MRGLGKTVTTLCSIERLNALPCVIIAPKFALMVWQNEIKKWLGQDAIIYSGKPKERQTQWAEFINTGCKFLITNYAMLGEIALKSGIKLDDINTVVMDKAKFKWQGIIWDEAHMGGLFNHKNTAYKLSLKLARIIPTRYCLTGTPFRQGCADLFGPLSLMDPKKFNSYWSFVNTFCIVTVTPFGKQIERNPANLQSFRTMLNRYVVRRIKDEVLQELPGKLRQPLLVEMNSEQKKIYRELSEELMVEIPEREDLLITPNAMSLIVRQRQLLACPQVLGLKGRGAAMDAIMAHSHLSLDEDKPIVIFTPFRKALPYLEEAFLKEYPQVKIYQIRGQLTAQEFGAAWMGFQEDKYKQKVMFCVIKSGASFQATEAATAYFLGYEWDFTLNEQAEDRLHRMGQKGFVNIYYLMTRGSVDDLVIDRLNTKKSSSDLVVGTERQYMQALRRTYGA